MTHDRSQTECPCGSGAPYGQCCAPFHRGEREAPDAECLMRSRFAAFALTDAAYLWRTLHADHEERAGTERQFVANVVSNARHVRYRSLVIVSVEAPDADDIAHVTFRAEVFVKGKDRSFTERSSFVHDGVGWRYLAGEMQP